MKNIAIISEYNPFHNGHKFQIEKTRQIIDNSCNVICIMSGNFVQRGDLSIYDKHTRANMAILGGADLVIELPLPYALASAEYFAKGSVSLLNKLNLVDYLCFGSECGDIDILCKIANTVTSDDFSSTLKKHIKTGISYPRALDLALEEINSNFNEIVKNPNNTLGIEYIKALISLNSSIKPMTITRKNVEHHSEFENDGFASASYIRQNINQDISHLLPSLSANIIENLTPNNIVTIENSILSYLKRKDVDFFTKINDVTEGLEHKIVKALKTATTLDELYIQIKSKRYTLSRIRRIVLNSYLEITKYYLQIEPQYVKVLAFNDNGRKIIKQLKETCELPVIIKPNGNYNLNEYGRKLFDLDCLATDLYSMSYADIKMRTSSNELKKSPIYVNQC